MKYTTDEGSNYVVIYFEGSLTAEHREKIEKQLNDIFEKKKHAILDFSKVSFIDSSSLGVFVVFSTVFRKVDRNLLIANISKQIYEMFMITGMDRKIILKDTLQGAVDSVKEN